jgi:hypothetical protein
MHTWRTSAGRAHMHMRTHGDGDDLMRRRIGARRVRMQHVRVLVTAVIFCTQMLLHACRATNTYVGAAGVPAALAALRAWIAAATGTRACSNKTCIRKTVACTYRA